MSGNGAQGRGSLYYVARKEDVAVRTDLNLEPFDYDDDASVTADLIGFHRPRDIVNDPT